MEINENTTVGELLVLWVKYTDKSWKKNSSTEASNRLKEINRALDTRGVTSISILQIKNESYKLRYSNRDSNVEKEIPLMQ